MPRHRNRVGLRKRSSIGFHRLEIDRTCRSRGSFSGIISDSAETDWTCQAAFPRLSELDNAPDFSNRTLFHGDNPDFMRYMNSESVDLIATDPPFDKGLRLSRHSKIRRLPGRHFKIGGLGMTIFIRTGLIRLSTIIRNFGALSKRPGSRMAMPWELLSAFWQCGCAAPSCILKPTGSIYIHCDQKANAYIRMMMDAIFGMENFRNEIIRCYTGPSPAKSKFPAKYDAIWFYLKSEDHHFDDDSPRVPYKRPNTRT